MEPSERRVGSRVCYPLKMDARARDRERFLQKLGPQPFADVCWKWPGPYDARRSYGSFYSRVAKRKVGAHRFAYEAFIAPIPPGYEVDHVCARNGGLGPSCVNPRHLEVRPRSAHKRGRPTKIDSIIQRERRHHAEDVAYAISSGARTEYEIRRMLDDLRRERVRAEK
jgi:hypothetical protein